jgi:LuxR family maltose regulon positive regulatory protein
MPSTLLENKFHIPIRLRGDISRLGLSDILDMGLIENRKFTLVSAPVGYGQTTLLANWVQSMPMEHKISWLSPDECDNELSRFLQ